MAKEYLHRAKGVVVKIVGLGGGGSSVVSEVSRDIDRASFYIADTDLNHLKQVRHKKVSTFSFGQEDTSGMGTGMQAKEAHKIAQKEQHEIRKLFSDADFSVLVSCLGGGVGSGALPVFADMAQQENNLTLGVFTLPFEFEGPQKSKIARRFLKKAQKNLDAVVIIENERIFEIADSHMSFQEALSQINQHLINDLQGLVNIIRCAGTINIDFADLKAILQGEEGTAYLSSVQAEGDKRVTMIKENIVKNPLFRSSLADVRRVLYNISGGVDITMSEVEEISEHIRDFNPRAQIIFGLYRRRNFHQKIKVDLLAMVGGKGEKSLPEEKKSKINESKQKNKGDRRNALEIKKSQTEGQFEETEKEKRWQKPAFLRRK